MNIKCDKDDLKKLSINVSLAVIVGSITVVLGAFPPDYPIGARSLWALVPWLLAIGFFLGRNYINYRKYRRCTNEFEQINFTSYLRKKYGWGTRVTWVAAMGCSYLAVWFPFQVNQIAPTNPGYVSRGLTKEIGQYQSIERGTKQDKYAFNNSITAPHSPNIGGQPVAPPSIERRRIPTRQQTVRKSEI